MEEKKTAKNTNVKKLWWTLVLLALGAATIYVVTSQNKDFSFSQFLNFLATASPWWLLASGVCMVGFIYFEGHSIAYLCRLFGQRCRRHKGFVYAATDIYFSALTPSATGGQPAAAYCMMRDGLPAATTTMALLMNLMMYNVSLIVLAIFCFAVRPGIYTYFDPLAHVFIWIGIAVQGFMTLVFFLLAFRASLVMRIAQFGLKLLRRLRLIRQKRAEKYAASLECMAEEYRYCIHTMWHHGGAVLRVFLYNFLQRLSQLCVTVCVFLALGNNWRQSLDVFCIQSFAVLGSNSMPVPGAMGVADYLFINGFRPMLSSEEVINIELLSRGISFYCCFFLCGLAILVNYGLFAHRSRRAIRQSAAKADDSVSSSTETGPSSPRSDTSETSL